MGFLLKLRRRGGWEGNVITWCVSIDFSLTGSAFKSGYIICSVNCMLSALAHWNFFFHVITLPKQYLQSKLHVKLCAHSFRYLSSRSYTEQGKISNYSCFFRRIFSLSLPCTQKAQLSTRPHKWISNLRLIRHVNWGSRSPLCLRNKEEEDPQHLTRPFLYFVLTSIPA